MGYDVVARILNLPNKLQEIGRIRAGFKDQEKKSGDKREALDEWRFTSPNEDAIRKIADLYGGTPHIWPERITEYEVFTTSKSLSVQLPADPIFTAYEKWGQGGNQRRCDGERCVVPVQDPQGGHLDEVPCWCEAHNMEPGEHKDACVVTVRLKVVMHDVPGLGIWMLTSSSVYAAMELPAVCDLIDALRQRSGILIPCKLELQYREEKRAYEKFTRKYHVPTLHVDESVQEIATSIRAIESGRSIVPALAAPKPALAPGAGAPAVRPDLPPAPREPSQSPGEPPGPPDDTLHPSYLRELCLEHELDDSGEPRELIARLTEAGVKV